MVTIRPTLLTSPIFAVRSMIASLKPIALLALPIDLMISSLVSESLR